MFDIISFGFCYLLMAACFCSVLSDIQNLRYVRTVSLFWLPILIVVVAIGPIVVLLIGGDFGKLGKLWAAVRDSFTP